MAQSEINISIGNRDPKDYFAELRAQVDGGPLRYGGITEQGELEQNLAENCIPMALLRGEDMGYDEFLVERRKLMAGRIRAWFEKL